jgi:hypothetical protein
LELHRHNALIYPQAVESSVRWLEVDHYFPLLGSDDEEVLGLAERLLKDEAQ